MATILVMERNDNLRLILSEELREEGHIVLATGSSREALHALQSAVPDLVVLDDGPQGVYDLELLGKLLELDSRFPVVIHTTQETMPPAAPTSRLAPSASRVAKRSDSGRLKREVQSLLAGAPQGSA